MGDRMSERRIRHSGTVADPVGASGTMLILRVVGARPKDKPYLRISTGGSQDKCLASIDNANALRGLARAILRSLGDA